MSNIDYFDHLVSTDLNAQPRFFVEHPEGIEKMPEIKRQALFIHLMSAAAPQVAVFANANAGKRAPHLAAREGITAGVFDLTVVWGQGRIAFPEFKGFDKNGRAGRLSRSQIDWGNRMHALGHDVACFFDHVAAVNWLRGKGCPIRGVK